MISSARLIKASHTFEKGKGVAGFARRIRIERAIFVLTSRICKLELGMELSGFNPIALGEVKRRLHTIQASDIALNSDVLVGFELKHQLVILSLSEPYRFSPTEKIDSRALREFGRQLHKWTKRASRKLLQ
jgi:hypothetical protein